MITIIIIIISNVDQETAIAGTTILSAFAH